MTILEITEVLADLTNTAETEIAANLKKNADGEELKSKEEISQYVKGLFENKFKAVSQTNLGRAKKEARSEFEKEIKAKFGYEGSEQGLSIVDNLIKQRTTEAVEASSINLDELTEQDALKLPAVQNIVRGRLAEKEKEIEEVKKQLSDVETRHINNSKREIIKTEWLAMNPVLSENAQTRQRQVTGFMNTVNLDGFKLSEQQGQKVLIPVNENGEQLINTANFNPIPLRDRLREIDFFGFHEQDPNQGSPSPKSAPDAQPSKKNSELPSFKSEEELSLYLNNNLKKGADYLEAVLEKFNEEKK